MVGRGAQRPVLCGNELKKTGARSARARTRGQNPLVIKIHIGYANELHITERNGIKIRRKIWRISSWRAGTVDTINY